MDQWTGFQGNPASFGTWNGMDMTLTPSFQPVGQPRYGSFNPIYTNHLPPTHHRFESPVRPFLQPNQFSSLPTDVPLQHFDNFSDNVSPRHMAEFTGPVSGRGVTSTSNAKPFIMFAINFDNISVRNLCQEEDNLIYLIAYNHEIDLLSAMAVEDLLKLNDVEITNPEDGVRVLTTVQNMKLTVSENPSNKVYNVEKREEEVDKSNENDKDDVEKDGEEETKEDCGTDGLEDKEDKESKEDVSDDDTVDSMKAGQGEPESDQDSLESFKEQKSLRSRSDENSKSTLNLKRLKTENKSIQNVLKKLKNLKRPLEDDGRKIKMATQCAMCRLNHMKGLCVIENPKSFIPDNLTSTNSHILSYASLPSQFYLGISETIRGYTIYAAEKILAGTAFGPVTGQEIDYESIQCLTDLKYIWFIQPRLNHPVRPDEEGDEDGEEEVQTFLTTEDEMNSNWCRFLMPTLRFVDSNLYYVQTDKEIYFITRRNVKKGEEIQFYAAFMDDQQHLVLSNDELKCHRCNLDFDSNVNYIKHVRIVHPRGITRKKEKCKICHKVFHKYAHLANHAQNEHGGMGAYKCEQCGRDYLYARQLNRHIQTVHKQDNIEASTCSVCGSTFKNSWRLKHHIRRNHSEERFSCEKCNKVFNSKMGLERHFKTHTQEFAIFCDRCGKGFRDGSNLKVHLLTHSGIKPFSCQHEGCGTAYTTKQCLQIHYRKAHGYSDDSMPEIIRTVPFTVEAHSVENSI